MSPGTEEACAVLLEPDRAPMLTANGWMDIPRRRFYEGLSYDFPKAGAFQYRGRWFVVHFEAERRGMGGMSEGDPRTAYLYLVPEGPTQCPPTIRIRDGWHDSGRCGQRLGPDVDVLGQPWTPVLWDDEEDPDFHKAAGLEEATWSPTSPGARSGAGS